MLISKGGLITRDYDTSVFMNYSTYYGNSYDYSSILTADSSANIRYSTFAWKIVNPISPSTAIYSKIFLKLTFPPDISLNAQSGGGFKILCRGITSNINITYRIEDASNPSPPSTSTPSANVSSVWINGNSTTGSSVSSANYFQQLVKIGLFTGTSGIYYGFDNGNPWVKLPLRCPNNITSNSRTGQTLYISIGGQNNACFKILNIQALLGISTDVG